jgi:putative peptidoglycan lipid II flippase
MATQNTTKATILIMGAVVIGKLFAFAKDATVAGYFGMGVETDAYNVGNNITAVIFLAVYSTINLAFLPLYNKKRHRSTAESLIQYSNRAMVLYIIISAAITIFGICFSRQLVYFAAPSLSEETSTLAVNLTRIFCLSFVFSSVVGVISTVQYANKQFLGPQLIPALNNLIVLAALFIFATNYGIYPAAIAGVSAWIIQIPIQKKFAQYYFYFKLRFPSIKQLFVPNSRKILVTMFIPVFVGVCIDQTNILIDTNLGSRLESGSISALNYAHRLVTLSSGVFIALITALVFPMFSDFVVSQEINRLNSKLQSILRYVVIATLPMVFISIVFSNQIVSIAFGRGEFGEHAIATTASVFVFYSLCIFSVPVRELLNRVLLSFENAKATLYISAMCVSVNLILSVIFMKQYGVSGLALATSLSVIFVCAVQIVYLRRHLSIKANKAIAIFVAQILCASLLTISAMCYSKAEWSLDNDIVDLLVGSTVCAVVFVTTLYILKLKEINLLCNQFLGKKKKRL